MPTNTGYHQAGRIDATYFTRFKKVTQVTPTEQGLLAEVDDELLRIDVIRADILRIKISRGRHFDEQPTFAVCANLNAHQATFNLDITAERALLDTGQITLTLGRTPFHLEARRKDGSLVFTSMPEQDGSSWAYATLNDEFVVYRSCRQQDAFLGLGEKTGRLNRKGEDYTLWNTDVLNGSAVAEFKAGYPAGHPRADETSTGFDPYYVSIPFFYHLSAEGSAAAGFFVDNGYRARFDFSPAAEYGFHFLGGQYTEYIFAGPQLSDILAGYTWLTGRMQPPPLWSLGYHQCRWHAYTQTTLEALADQVRTHKIPCDTLWLDIDYMDGYRVFTWNQEAFPDSTATLKRLSDQGFRAITIIDPGVKFDPGYPVYDQAVERDVLCKTEQGATYIGQVWPGKTVFPDFVTPEARAWWGELNAAHVKSGLAGIWNDMNEPATGDIRPDAMRFGKGQYSHARFHNQYALLMAMGTTEGLLQAMPDRRTFVLSRAGFAGIQRYAANWMGDNLSRWDHLWMSLPMGMGLGLSGQPFIGADIGGFSGNANPELFTRWIQCGALVPFCRNHSSTGHIDQYPWSFGEVYEELARQALEMRYKLLPYIYSAFMHSAETGAPVQQALVFAFQNDPTLRDIDDQYLLGSQLLVAPVYTPGTTSRHVYLPEGSWYDWHSGECLPGKRFITAATPMDMIPVYARGGAVIPTWPEAPATTDGHHPEKIELHIFVPLADGEYSSMLHEDDGLTFAFQNGNFLRTTFSLRRSGNQINLHGQVSGHGYPEFARQAFELVWHGATPKNLLVNGQTVTVQDERLLIPNRGSELQISAQLH